jgi:Terminase RNaseH-like domain
LDLDYLYNKFEYVPHAGQLKVHEACQKYRNICVLFGRRGGKSHASGFESAIGLLEPPHPVFGSPCVLVTAPTVDLTKAVFENAHDLLFKYCKEFDPHYSRTERTLELRRLGSQLLARSGDKPSSVVSRGFSKCIIDEAGFYREDTYQKLRPTLLERQGKLIVIGVPELKNFYFKLWKESKKLNSKVYSLQLPSIVNPNIAIDEWHELYRTTPRQEFLRQYCARFIEDHSSVWKTKDIENLKGGQIEEPKEGNIYLAGLDLARKLDYTVLTLLKPIINGKLQVVFRVKLNNIGWSNQAEIIAYHLNRYNVQACVVDATGIGDSVVEQLANKTTSGLEAFIFTNESKANLIDSLTLQIESENILIPETFEEYFIEMSLFEIIKSKDKGLRVFQAPEGYHDDHVISLALANRAYQFHYYA